jgi:hypothetical protein
MQGLGGTNSGLNRGATMSGNKPNTGTPYFTALSPGQTSWTAPASRWYRLTAIGGGGMAAVSNGGGGGGAAQKLVYIPKGTTLVIAVGQGGANIDAGTATTVTLPDGTVLTGGGGAYGTTGAGGTASGGDINVTGNAKSTINGGDGPTIGDFIGAPFTPPGGVALEGMGAIGVGGTYKFSTQYPGGDGILYIAGE